MLILARASPISRATASVAISYVSAATDGTNATEYTFSSQNIGTAAADREVLIAIVLGATSSRTISSVTVAGESATIDVETTTTVSSGGVFTTVAVARALVSSGSTGNVVVTASGASLRCGIAVYRMTGNAGAPHETQSAVATSSPASVSIDVPANGGVVSTVGISGTTVGEITWTGAAEDVEQTIENANQLQGAASDVFASAQSALSVEASIASGVSRVGIVAASYGA